MSQRRKNIFLIFLLLALGVLLMSLNLFFWQQKKYIREEVFGSREKIVDDRGGFLKALLLNSESFSGNEEVMSDYRQEVSWLFFGDLMLDRNVKTKIDQGGLSSLLAELKNDDWVYNYDLVAGNLEGAVSDEGRHYAPANAYDFAFSPELISQLKDYNFSYFNLANNHLSDQGSLGIEETYRNLSRLGFYYSGCRDAVFSNSSSSPITEISWGEAMPELNENNCSDIILKIKGQKIALLSLSAVYADLDWTKVLDRVKLLKANSDWLIINSHLGFEYQTVAGAKQRDLYHQMIESGADAIIGHHPHVVQEYEVYQGKPIFYSLGNFIFDQYFSAETQAGLAVGLKLSPDQSLSFDVYDLSAVGSRITAIKLRPKLEEL